MEIRLFDEGDRAPQPREAVRIESVTIVPYPDRFRVLAVVQVTPFLERPNLLLVAHDAEDRIVAELNIIETMHAHMEFTLHLRGKQDPAGTYTLTAELFYDTRVPPQDRRIEAFDIPDAPTAGDPQDPA